MHTREAQKQMQRKRMGGRSLLSDWECAEGCRDGKRTGFVEEDADCREARVDEEIGLAASPLPLLDETSGEGMGEQSLRSSSSPLSWIPS